MRKMTLAAPALLLAGCLVVVDDDRHRTAPPPPPPAHTATVVYTSSWHDTRYVVWREYYDCDDYDIYYCESLHGYDEDDLLVLLYISRFRRIPIRTVVFEYDRCRRDLFSVSLAFRMTGDEFFHPAVQPGYCPPPYGHAYGYYWKQERNYRLNNEEIRALVHLRISVEYYGYKPHDYFREHERYRAQGQTTCFREVAVRDYKQAGSGGKNIHAVPVKKVERPWEVQNRHEWEQRRDDSRERARVREAAEPPRHPEAERARRQFEEAEKARKEEAARKTRDDEEQRHRATEDKRKMEEAQRRKAADDEERRRTAEGKKKSEDAQRRAEEQRRRQEEEKRFEEQKRKQEDQKKQEEQKRVEDQKRKQEEQKRAEDEKRKQDEEKRRDDQKKRQEDQKKQDEKKRDEKKQDRRP